MIAAASDSPILVPVANPASVEPLLAYAAAFAGADGVVELLTVIGRDADEQAHADAVQGLHDVECMARQMGTNARGHVRVADDVATGVLEQIAEQAPSLVVMGWRGVSSSTDVFGRLIDHVVGRSSVPLAVVRHGSEPVSRILFPVSGEHLLPGGGGSLALAVELTRRLRSGTGHPTTVLRTGSREMELPAEVGDLGDRIHHDPRRTHKAVEAFARADDMIVAAVAPTASGLRAATTHLAWAAPEATLVVAVDVGPRRDNDLVQAVSSAGQPAPARSESLATDVRIVVTIRLPEGEHVTAERVERILRTVGQTDLLMSWWPANDTRAHLGATVTVSEKSVNAAMAAVMTVVHEAPELSGAEISYELDRGSPKTRSTAAASERQ